MDFSGVDTGTGIGECGLEVCARRLFLERGWWLNMRWLWVFMFALPTELMVTVKAWSQPRIRFFRRWRLHRQYCKRNAKNMFHDRQFQLAHPILCFQWHTGDTASRISRSTRRLLLVGIRSDTGEELIDSAGADDGTRVSSMDASGLSAQQSRISWHNRQNAGGGEVSPPAHKSKTPYRSLLA